MTAKAIGHAVPVPLNAIRTIKQPIDQRAKRSAPPSLIDTQHLLRDFVSLRAGAVPDAFSQRSTPRLRARASGAGFSAVVWAMAHGNRPGKHDVGIWFARKAQAPSGVVVGAGKSATYMVAAEKSAGAHDPFAGDSFDRLQPWAAPG
jgi:hypothetical protein